METFQETACRLVFEYVKPRLEKTDRHVTFSIDECYIVWFNYTLGNWKALVSTTLPDGMYYEVTHNANKNETYIDAYKKFDNVMVSMPSPPGSEHISAQNVRIAGAVQGAATEMDVKERSVLLEALGIPKDEGARDGK
jgi:hypothetical protein